MDHQGPKAEDLKSAFFRGAKEFPHQTTWGTGANEDPHALDLCIHAKSLWSCLTLCGPMDRSPPGSSVHGDSPGKNTRMGCQILLPGALDLRSLDLLEWVQRNCISSKLPGGYSAEIVLTWRSVSTISSLLFFLFSFFSFYDPWHSDGCWKFKKHFPHQTFKPSESAYKDWKVGSPIGWFG